MGQHSALRARMERSKWLMLCLGQERGGMWLVSKEILRRGANAQLESGINFGAPLHVAVLMGNQEMVELLTGENPEAADCKCE